MAHLGPIHPVSTKPGRFLCADPDEGPASAPVRSAIIPSSHPICVLSMLGSTNGFASSMCRIATGNFSPSLAMLRRCLPCMKWPVPMGDSLRRCSTGTTEIPNDDKLDRRRQSSRSSRFGRKRATDVFASLTVSARPANSASALNPAGTSSGPPVRCQTVSIAVGPFASCGRSLIASGLPCERRRR